MPSGCEAEDGLAADVLDVPATDPDTAEGELVTDHEVPVEDLAPATEVFWRARAEDADGSIVL